MIDGQRRSRTVATKAEGQQWAIEQEALIKTGTTIVGAKSVADAMERYAREVSAVKRGRRWEEVRLGRFVRDVPFAHADIQRVSAAMVGAWRDARLKTVSSATVCREMTLLGHVFEVARRDWGWLVLNPFKDVRRPANSRPRKQRVSETDRGALLLALGYTEDAPVTTTGQRVAVCFLLALETGMRSGELCGLRWPEVVGKTARLTQTKNGDARVVPLSVRALALIAKLPRGGETLLGLSDAVRDVVFRKAKKKAGITGLHFHDTRREALTNMAAKLQPMELAKVSGHRDLKILLSTYYAPDMEALADKLG
jgi:integrase